MDHGGGYRLFGPPPPEGNSRYGAGPATHLLAAPGYALFGADGESHAAAAYPVAAEFRPVRAVGGFYTAHGQSIHGAGDVHSFGASGYSNAGSVHPFGAAGYALMAHGQSTGGSADAHSFGAGGYSNAEGVHPYHASG
jgi:hypothetical protein